LLIVSLILILTGIASHSHGANLGAASVEVARNYLSVREKTNSNDHPFIDEALAYCGLGPGYAWCQASYVRWVAKAYGKRTTPFPRYASCAKLAKWAVNNSLRVKAISSKQVAMGAYKPQRGDLASFRHGYASPNETFSYNGHAGMTVAWDSKRQVVKTIEGNTKPGPGGDQTGRMVGDLSYGRDGVYERERGLGIGSKFPILYFIRPISWEVSP
jgi:hypothetical protein